MGRLRLLIASVRGEKNSIRAIVDKYKENYRGKAIPLGGKGWQPHLLFGTFERKKSARLWSSERISQSDSFRVEEKEFFSV